MIYENQFNSSKLRQLQSLALKCLDSDVEKVLKIAKISSTNYNQPSDLRRALEKLKLGTYSGQSVKLGQVMLSDDLKQQIIDDYYSMSTLLPLWKDQKQDSKNTIRVRVGKITDKVLLG